MHGFDEFFGNFHHLNAEEEPENVDYPKDPAFKAKFGPRGVFKCKATDTVSTLPDDPRFGPWGKQNCEDTGPLNNEAHGDLSTTRWLEAAQDFIERRRATASPSSSGSTPRACTSGRTCSPESKGKTGLGIYADGMDGARRPRRPDAEAARRAGASPKDTIVIWSSDNGAEVMSWPDGGTTPFRGEKNTNWEGGYRVPLVVRWPGVIKPGTKMNDIISHEDWVPTLMAAVGRAGLKDDLLKGSKSAARSSRCTSTATT